MVGDWLWLEFALNILSVRVSKHRVLIVAFTILSYAAYSSGVDCHASPVPELSPSPQNSPLLCLQGVKQQLSLGLTWIDRRPNLVPRR